MNRLAIIGALLFGALALSACAAKQPTPPPPLEIVPQDAPEAEATATPPTAEDLLAQQPSEVQAAIKQHEQDGSWQVFRTDQAQLYPYGERPDPIIDCEPLRSTDIQLQSGETITDVVMGDSERWQATPAASGDPRNPVPHVAIKPQAPGIRTNLAIYTTRHIYHLNLRSRPGHGVEQVEFYYPDELLAAMRDADRQTSQTGVDHASGSDGVVVASLKSADPADLNFSYKIAGPDVPWRPVRAFDDGAHVYIQMPPTMKTADAPALLIAASGGNQMVNYRVRGNYYVVDRLFDNAVMVAGVGREQDRVSVAYTGGAR
ncbi:MAG: P-type conjugative transfer protein TrbG [Candidatus Binatus sp.]|uniref:P-type conjugative transfer protein TrbG n=1 Tax=Candidatus Binatus sp. TaxID=2811406 RepID=UPI003BB055FD